MSDHGQSTEAEAESAASTPTHLAASSGQQQQQAEQASQQAASSLLPPSSTSAQLSGSGASLFSSSLSSTGLATGGVGSFLTADERESLQRAGRTPAQIQELEEGRRQASQQQRGMAGSGAGSSTFSGAAPFSFGAPPLTLAPPPPTRSLSHALFSPDPLLQRPLAYVPPSSYAQQQPQRPAEHGQQPDREQQRQQSERQQQQEQLASRLQQLHLEQSQVRARASAVDAELAATTAAALQLPSQPPAQLAPVSQQSAAPSSASSSSLSLLHQQRLLDRLSIDKASKAPRLDSEAHFLNWRESFMLHQQSHGSWEVLSKGPSLLTLPDTQQQLYAMRGPDGAGPTVFVKPGSGFTPAEQLQRELELAACQFSYQALIYACSSVPSAAAAVQLAPAPNSFLAWQHLHDLLMPQTFAMRTLAETELMQLQQRAGESVREYTLRAQELATRLIAYRAPPDERTLVSRYLYGMRSLSQARRDMLRMLPVVSFLTVSQRAIQFEMEDQAAGVGSSKGSQQTQAAAFAVSRSSASTPGLVCYWCRKAGHKQSECRSKLAGRPQVQADAAELMWAEAHVAQCLSPSA
jgi:hypothetical protein